MRTGVCGKSDRQESLWTIMFADCIVICRAWRGGGMLWR